MEGKSCCSGRSNFGTSTTCGNNTSPKKETVATTTPAVKKEDAVNIVKPSDMADCGSTPIVNYPKTEEEKQTGVSVKKEEPVKVNVGCDAASGFKPNEE
ncbi:hypothetical protein LguiA_031246 [Lonicera macranthoides]